MENETPKPPTSHDYAKRLRETADFLESRPSFVVPNIDRPLFTNFCYREKEPFIAAVKAIGTGKKAYSGDDIRFEFDAPFARIVVEAPRASVCRLVTPAVYECEPFLSPDEEKELGGGS